jgi:hypothetical protein
VNADACLFARASCTRYLAGQGDVFHGSRGVYRATLERRLDALPNDERAPRSASASACRDGPRRSARRPGGRRARDARRVVREALGRLLEAARDTVP